MMLTGLPHVRGGVSTLQVLQGNLRASSPRAWGCFYIMQPMDLQLSSLPHVRGGVSAPDAVRAGAYMSSPRAWGCFSQITTATRYQVVFPTCVGVFLWLSFFICSRPRLPHVRGGVSAMPGPDAGWLESSPRAWGCFYYSGRVFPRGLVFPTCVGVFLSGASISRSFHSLPHVRGGVSAGPVPPSGGQPSSPRAWGCFWLIEISTYVDDVFPTHVGCF